MNALRPVERAFNAQVNTLRPSGGGRSATVYSEDDLTLDPLIVLQCDERVFRSVRPDYHEPSQCVFLIIMLIIIHSFIHSLLRPLLWVANIPCKSIFSAAICIWSHRFEPQSSLLDRRPMFVFLVCLPVFLIMWPHKTFSVFHVIYHSCFL